MVAATQSRACVHGQDAPRRRPDSHTSQNERSTLPGKQNAHWCQRRRGVDQGLQPQPQQPQQHTTHGAWHGVAARLPTLADRARAHRQQGPRRAGQAEPSACTGVRRRPPSGKLLPPRPHLWARLPLWVWGSAGSKTLRKTGGSARGQHGHETHERTARNISDPRQTNRSQT